MGKSRLIYATAGLITAVLLAVEPVVIRAETAARAPTGIRSTSVPSQEGMSAAASKILHHIVEARAAIHTGEPKRAERELHEAFVLLDHIKSVRPSTRVANHIWVAEKHLNYQDPHEVALDLIPIEISLTDLEEVVSARRAKRHLQDTKTHLGRGDAEAARKELKQLRESLAQTEVDLPLTSTEQHINRAFVLLAEGKAAGAEEALKEAEAGVRFVSLGKSAPLAKARRALWQAMEDYSAGHHEAVKADLAQASKWLERVKDGADTKTGREAQQLHIDIKELLGRETHKTPEAESELAGFWHRTVGLIEHEAEELYHAWRDQQSGNHLYKQLIDAKLHLFYAEHELFESRDAEGGRKELEEATGYLRAAAAEASGPRKSRIEVLEKEVTAIGSLVDNPDAKVRSRYDKALADLRRMVEEM